MLIQFNGAFLSKSKFEITREFSVNSFENLRLIVSLKGGVSLSVEMFKVSSNFSEEL